MKMFLVLFMSMFFIACGSSDTNEPGPTDPTPPPVGTADCNGPMGVIKHGNSQAFYKDAEVEFGQSCMSEVRACSNGVLSGSYAQGSCIVKPDSEPASHEKPFKLSDEGLKMGGIKDMGDKHIVVSASRQFSPKPPPRPVCSSIPVLGSICQPNMPICQNAEDTVEYSCGVKKTYKIFGWIYEKKGLDHSKMAEGVKVDVFWFAGCLAGICEPSAGPVYSDKWGYFELTTGWLLDTLRIDGMPKYYMFCQKGKPIAGGGQYITDKAGKAIGPFKQLINAPDVCLE